MNEERKKDSNNRNIQIPMTENNKTQKKNLLLKQRKGEKKNKSNTFYRSIRAMFMRIKLSEKEMNADTTTKKNAFFAIPAQPQTGHGLINPLN